MVSCRRQNHMSNSDLLRFGTWFDTLISENIAGYEKRASTPKLML